MPAPVKVYGSPIATCTARVVFAGFELGHPIDIVPVDFATNQHKSPEHLKRQPFGKVPAAEDGDLQFYESRAICRYLNDKYNGGLVPTDIKERAAFEQWMSLESTTYTPEIAVIMMQFFGVKWRGLPKDQAAVDKAAANLQRDGHVLNDQLGKHQWIAGDKFTLVDVIFPTYLYPVRNEPEIQQWFKDFPNIAAWFARVTSRPAYKQLLEAQGGAY